MRKLRFRDGNSLTVELRSERFKDHLLLTRQIVRASFRLNSRTDLLKIFSKRGALHELTLIQIDLWMKAFVSPLYR